MLKATSKPGTTFVCSWSGGKDSCLALYRLTTAGARPSALLNMLDETGRRSRSHGLALEVLQAQAASLGIPLVTRAATWDDYEATFIAALQELKETGIGAAVFGDIDLEDHLQWENKVCQAAGLEPYLPLWKGHRLELLDEFLTLGFKATVIATNDEKMGQAYLGKTLDTGLIREFDRIGIDPCGEEGEYHTVVTDGPLFARPLSLKKGEVALQSGYWFLDMQVAS